MITRTHLKYPVLSLSLIATILSTPNLKKILENQDKMIFFSYLIKAKFYYTMDNWIILLTLLVT